MQTIMVSGNVQDATDKQGGQASVNSGSRFYNSFLTYMLALQEKQLSVSFSLNYSKVISSLNTTDIVGPVVSLNKMLLNKKMRLSAASAFNKTMVHGGSGTNVYSLRLNSSYQAGNGHQLQLSCSTMRKSTAESVGDTGKGKDLVIMLGYSYQFSSQ
jgi:hypothetical protein